MYSFRHTHALARGVADLAFTGRDAGDLREAAVRRAVLADFAPGDELVDLHQVHGSDVHVVGVSADPTADAAVTDRPGVTLQVKVADCVPVVLVADEVVGVAHGGRAGLVAGVVPAVLDAMADLGAAHVTAWVGPHVCGRCYEVPEDLQSEVVAAVPATRATTSWGTPSLDLGAGVRAQLEAGGASVVDVARCTRESDDLFSYRRDGERAGRFAGLVRRSRG